MWRAIVIVFVLSPMLAYAAGLCPAQIPISETTNIDPQGFRVFLKDGKGPRPLMGMEFFIGRPENLAELVPDNPNPYETIWQFSPTDSIWVVCDYRDSALTLTHELPARTTVCEVKWSDPYLGGLFGQRLVDSTKCW